MRTLKYGVSNCLGWRRPRTPVLHTIGLVFMVVGGLILLISVPIKVWFALIGLILLVFGFILWRFG